MFGSKKYTVAPAEYREGLLVHFSQPVEITKKTKITVPANYKAIAFIDSEPQFRINPCKDKKFVKTYKKDYLGKSLSIAYISSCSFSLAPWGFGNIQINNKEQNETYRVGTNGEFSIEVSDYSALVTAFPGAKEITTDMIREKCLSTIKMVGAPVITECFEGAEVSVFSLDKLIAPFKERFISSLKEERIFSKLGVKITNLTVNGFYINPDDLEEIKKQKNI